MPRYRDKATFDDEPLIEIDGAFVGFRSRVQPAALPPGVASYLENMRCERGEAQVRKGTKALTTDLVLSNPAVVLDFVLPTEIAVTSITRSGSTATVTTETDHGYTTGDYVGIEGADQTEYNGDPQITVTGTTTFTYAVSGTPATPATGTIVTAKGPRIFDTYDDLVHAACVFADRDNLEGIVLATTNTAFLYRYGESIAEIAYPANETVTTTDACHLEQYVNSVYLFRGYQTAEPIAVSTLTSSGTTATVTTAAAHGRTSGDWVTIAGADQVGYNGVFQITVTDTDEFTYTCASGLVTPATGTITARPCKIPLVWDGDTANDFVAVTAGAYASSGTLIRMPAVDWGVEFSRRLVLGYDRDEIILSDFSNAAAYDTQYSQLRIRPGGNDWLVGVLPYQQRGLLILYRKSVHQVFLQTTDLAPASVAEITRDFGCLAWRSAANCGDVLLWLSDQGVTGARVDGEALNVIPLALPLSHPIQDIIDRINWPYASRAVGRFWNNRYYLAVPLDDATTNNALLVFNFLNRSPEGALGEWESVDTFVGSFDMVDLLVMDYADEQRLHLVTSYGWVFLAEQLEADEFGAPGTPVTTHPIAAVLESRDYRCGTLDRKHFGRVQIESNVTTADAFTITFTTRNPDSSAELLDYTATATTDVSHRLRSARQRGVGGVVEIATTAGRPTFRTISVEARTTDRGTFTRP